MLRLRKYLKPYTFFIILSISLLFFQANADLALPDYLSKIVNNGIQQNGVENAVPIAIRQSEMERLLLFMSDDESARVVESYVLLEPSSANADAYLDDYPLLAAEPVYIRKDGDRAEIDALNAIMGKAWLVVSGIEQMAADTSQAPPMDFGFDFDPSMIPEGMDVFEVLKMLPDAQRSVLRARLDEMVASLGKSMITQMAGIRSARHGCRSAADQLHPAHRRFDAADLASRRHMRHRRRLSGVPSGSRRST